MSVPPPPFNVHARPGGDVATVLKHFAFAGMLLLGMVFLGLGLFAASCHARGRAEATGREAMIAGLPIKSVSADEPDPADVGKLVHVSGRARPDRPVVDDQMGISLEALMFERRTRMYQWVETCTQHDSRPAAEGPDVYVEREFKGFSRRNLRRGEVVVWHKCVYKKEWKDTAQAISPERSDRYGNPTFPLEEGTHRYRPIVFALGRLTVATERLPDLPADALQPMRLSDEHLANLPEPLRGRARIDGNAIHLGDLRAPKVGDLRIDYMGRAEMTITIVGERDAFGVKPYRLPDGTDFFQVREGTLSVADLAGVRRSAVGDSWTWHLLFAPFVVTGSFLAFWPVRAWGRALPGPALLTGGGVLAFVPLGSASLYGLIVARAWWATDRSAAVLALVIAIAAGTLLLLANTVCLVLRSPTTREP